MEKFLLAPLLISKLGQDDAFRSFFSQFLKVLAAICAIAAIIVFFLGWKALFDMSSQGLIGGIFYQLAFAVAAYLVVHCILLRAVEIKHAVPGRSAVLSVSSVLLRLAGEAWGSASVLLGIGAGIFVWFAGGDAGELLGKIEAFFPFLRINNGSFASGAALIFQGFLNGVLALLVGYLLAELLTLLPGCAGSGKDITNRQNG
jgi:hypothetical protein